MCDPQPLFSTLISARDFSQLLRTRARRHDPSAKNHLGFQCHPFFGLMVETTPFLLEELRCAPHLVQDDPELRWMFGISDLILPT